MSCSLNSFKGVTQGMTQRSISWGYLGGYQNLDYSPHARHTGPVGLGACTRGPWF